MRAPGGTAALGVTNILPQDGGMTSKTVKSRKTTAPATPRADTPKLPENGGGQPNSTLTTSVYQQLRADILKGKLRPGEKLRAEALRQRFRTGSSPIREALNRLLAEGFVSLEEQKGFRVSTVSNAEFAELLRARCWIDSTAIMESAKRLSLEWEENLVLALHRLSKSSRGDASDESVDWEERHRAFHLALVGGCGSRWMIRISEQLFDAAERYRLLTTNQLSERDELAEHRAIVAACISGDGEKAAKLLERHYGQTFDIISRSMNKNAALKKA
jgi:DNA-binding GntR family transcriptional regulator